MDLSALGSLTTLLANISAWWSVTAQEFALPSGEG